MDTSKLKWNKLGVWIRPGTGDEGIPREQKLWAPMDLHGRTVLDLGGHIGCFAVYALNQGAKKVVSVEPHPDNCEMFEMNLKDHDNVDLYQAAVVESTYIGNAVPLYCTGRKGTSTHSLYSFYRRKTVDVPVMTLDDLLHSSRISAVKIDIEGSEYRLMDDILRLFPKFHVQMIGMELHAAKDEWKILAKRFVKELEKSYVPIVRPSINKAWFAKIGIWELR